MHELSIAEALLDTVTKWQRENGGTLLRLRVKAGRLAGIDPEALLYVWPMALSHAVPEVSGCKLEVEMLPLSLRCAACGKIATTERLMLICPSCGEQALRRQGGRELMIQDIEVDNV